MDDYNVSVGLDCSQAIAPMQGSSLHLIFCIKGLDCNVDVNLYYSKTITRRWGNSRRLMTSSDFKSRYSRSSNHSSLTFDLWRYVHPSLVLLL